VAGPSDMIDDGLNGFLVPLFDNNHFETKLAILMADETLREQFGSNGKESIKRFSREKICEAFYRFIL
jgi:GalNAc-alpha-(1->4)-GalNAc-alpha-(1->3)-diNAcBac-PP-undecaprenol alpha-1,4-N-acetyl-D-galactosaminyltransferase